MIVDIIQINELNNEFKQQKYVFVYFTASWCGPCKMMKPIFERLADTKSYQKVSFVKIDIDDGDDVAQKYSIRSVPTLILFVDGKEVKRTTGLQSFDQLTDILDLNI